MSQTPEGRIKDKVKQAMGLYRRHIYSFWPVQTGYGSSTLDCLGSMHGVSFAIETKADKTKKLTPRQVFIMDEMRSAGIMVFVIYDEETIASFADWLQAVHLFSGADLK